MGISAVTFDGTVTLGSLLTIITLLIALGVWLHKQGRAEAAAEARLKALEDGKVAVSDCLRSHGSTVTTEFCTGQHAKTNSALEKFTEEFAGLGITVQRLLTNQEWVMDSVKRMHEGGVKIANPHPPPLPPDPREREARDEWRAPEAE